MNENEMNAQHQVDEEMRGKKTRKKNEFKFQTQNELNNVIKGTRGSKNVIKCMIYPFA